MNRFVFSVFIVIGALACTFSVAQEKCGTVSYTNELKSEKKIPANDVLFENWLQQKMLEKFSGRNQQTQAPPYKVPVVVHIIHNGEALGTGTNIPDAQILSQMSVLNEDFKRLNADASNTPAEFASVAGSMDIEFVLAKQNPEGLATSGIVRVQGTKTGWTVDDNYELKSQDYWPAEDYLNIWVCNLVDDLVGYAQLPESTLPGLENSSTNRLTDGVVIWHRAFGSVDDGNFDLDSNFNKGRTVTHEVGHIFGLRHLWGDGSGCGDDYVTDTPTQNGSTSGCPANPQSTCSPAHNKMFQNFLDYTDDACMNLFTQGQVDRMMVVVENSPRRASLLTSHGLLEPTPVPNDLGIREILSPASTACSNTVSPIIEIRNYGSNMITSARIRLNVNGSVIETRDVVLNLNYLESAQVMFNDLLVSSGQNTISFEVILTNGVTDGNSPNNLSALNFFIPEFTTTPFSESFNLLPPAWTIENQDQQIGWQITTAPKDTPSNKALYLNFFDYEDGQGELDAFISPVFDLSAVTGASLIFDVAHAQYQGSTDRLKVIVLRDCERISTGTIIYDKSGQSLASAESTTAFFIPAGENDWRKEFISLSQFIGETHIQLAFIGINNWGNNLYLDNISVVTGELEDLTLHGMTSPGYVTCDTRPEPKIVVQNIGTVTITDFDVQYTVNNATTQVFPVDNLNLATGEEVEVTFPELALLEGVNELVINITSPNGKIDETPANNQQEFTIILNTAADKIPLRENFDQPFTPDWTIFNPSGGMNWQSTATNLNTSVYFNAYNNTTIGDESWLVSPVLDFSGTTSASVVFDISHATRSGREEGFRIMASKDCGNTYAALNVPFSSNESTTEWIPATDSDWQKNIIVNLNNFAGEEQVRIAFVVTNENGNNLFLDNVEFFTTSYPDLIEIEERYSIYGYNLADPDLTQLKITFNLPERQDVEYSVVDMMGKLHAHGTLVDILNQTYPLDLEQALSPGVYIVRLKIGNKYHANKVIVPR